MPYKNLEDKRAYEKVYYEKNKERIKAKSKAWAIENREKSNAHKREYELKNSEKIRKIKKKYREKNIERIKAKSKAYYEANRKKVKEYGKAYRKANKDKRTNLEARRRALKFRATIRLTELDKFVIDEMYELAKIRTEQTGFDWHVDHIVPLTKGGLHKPTNLQVVPAIWNILKSNRNCDVYNRVK
jgi:hypothetical protein